MREIKELPLEGLRDMQSCACACGERVGSGGGT